MPSKNSTPSARDVKRALREKINPEKAAFYPSFFKTGKGQYGEGDKFLGVVVPDQRKIANKFKRLPRKEIEKLLNDSIHECRLTGILILVHQYEKATDDAEQSEICDYYLSKLDRVNNWDLVDSSAHKILGDQLVDYEDRSILYELAESDHLWRQRVAMIATLTLIKQKDYGDALQLAEFYLDHPHDLMHKASGWMLREIGNRNEVVLKRFLNKHAKQMPRTMLRYSIEKLDAKTRAKYLGK